MSCWIGVKKWASRPSETMILAGIASEIYSPIPAISASGIATKERRQAAEQAHAL